MKNIASRVPADKTAATVTSKSNSNYKPKLESYSFISKTPIPIKPVTRSMLLANGFKNLTGVTFDRLTVIGMSRDLPKRWVCSGCNHSYFMHQV